MTSVNETCFKLSGVETTAKLDSDALVEGTIKRRRKRSTKGRMATEDDNTPKVNLSTYYLAVIRSQKLANQREFFYLFLETIHVIIRLNTCYCCSYC